jgi:CheY-like chemotaxis protein
MQPTKSTGLLTVLSISPFEDDHLSLQDILGHFGWVSFKADGHSAALAVLRQHDISVILCERDLKPGTWIEVLDHIRDLPHPPYLIVTSKFADERLWAEALNLGAWDVLARPLDRTEVLRVVIGAWQHWYDQIQMPVRVMKAAS